jgi:hypothetical protein
MKASAIDKKIIKTGNDSNNQVLEDPKDGSRISQLMNANKPNSQI